MAMVTSDAKHRTGDSDAFFTLEPGLMKLGGRWTIECSVPLDRKLRQLDVSPAAAVLHYVFGGIGEKLRRTCSDEVWSTMS